MSLDQVEKLMKKLIARESDLYLAKEFVKRQNALAKHLRIHQEKGPIDE